MAPLHCAALSEDAAMVTQIVRCRVDVNSKLTSNIAALACVKNDPILATLVSLGAWPSAIVSLLDARADVAFSHPTMKYQAINCCHRPDCVAVLIQAKADLNKALNNSATPAYIAAESGLAGSKK